MRWAVSQTMSEGKGRSFVIYRIVWVTSGCVGERWQSVCSVCVWLSDGCSSLWVDIRWLGGLRLSSSRQHRMLRLSNVQLPNRWAWNTAATCWIMNSIVVVVVIIVCHSSALSLLLLPLILLLTLLLLLLLLFIIIVLFYLFIILLLLFNALGRVKTPKAKNRSLLLLVFFSFLFIIISIIYDKLH